MDIEINTDILKSDASSMGDKVSILRSTMEQMNSAVLEMSGMWEGTAHDSFVTQYNSDYENMKEICDIVDKIIDCMNYAVTQYDQCDTEVKDVINALRI